MFECPLYKFECKRLIEWTILNKSIDAHRWYEFVVFDGNILYTMPNI